MLPTLSVTELIERIPELKAGKQLLLTGTIYTARDAAHARLADLMQRGEPLPFPLKNSIIYYCGPTPAKPGDAIGSCGPTTSSRMDPYTPLMLSAGVKAVIGKGPRSQAVKDALAQYQALYLAATGGVAALMARTVRKADVVAFADLGPEAVFRLEVVEFPVLVACDTYGNDVYNR